MDKWFSICENIFLNNSDTFRNFLSNMKNGLILDFWESGNVTGKVTGTGCLGRGPRQTLPGLGVTRHCRALGCDLATAEKGLTVVP